MTQQTKNRIIKWHDAWKPYYSLVAIAISTLTISWEITHAAFSVISSDTKELHANTAAIEQQRRDLATFKEDTKTVFGCMKEENMRRDNKIQQNALDIKGLLTENKRQ